jgi:D-3-phosphoglycerate dehydrogenase / 2-oxoglutarate reductase
MAKIVLVAARTFGRGDPDGANMLKQAGLELVYLPEKETAHNEILTLIRNPDTVAIVAGGEPITAEMISASPNLKVIAMHGVGLNQIDIEAATKREIVVKAVPGGNAEAVADLTFGLIIASARHITEADAAIRKGEWGTFTGSSVNDKTLGIVGFGAIGQAVARRTSGFNMKVLAFDIFRNEKAASNLHVTFVELDTLLSQADFISIHVPLTPNTTNLIDNRALSLVKKTAIIINISRGGIVNEEALCKALKEDRLAAAAVDTFSQEPLPNDHILRSAPRCILTPHMGGRTRESAKFIGIEVAKTILSGLE